MKRLLALGISICVLLFLSPNVCAEPLQPQDVNVKFEQFIGCDEIHTTVFRISAYSPNEELLWEKITLGYDAGKQYESVDSIGIWNGFYYYTDDFAVHKIDLLQGTDSFIKIDDPRFYYANFEEDGTLTLYSDMPDFRLVVINPEGRVIHSLSFPQLGRDSIHAEPAWMKTIGHVTFIHFFTGGDFDSEDYERQHTDMIDWGTGKCTCIGSLQRSDEEIDASFPEAVERHTLFVDFEKEEIWCREEIARYDIDEYDAPDTVFSRLREKHY